MTSHLQSNSKYHIILQQPYNKLSSQYLLKGSKYIRKVRILQQTCYFSTGICSSPFLLYLFYGLAINGYIKSYFKEEVHKLHL